MLENREVISLRIVCAKKRHGLQCLFSLSRAKKLLRFQPRRQIRSSWSSQAIGDRIHIQRTRHRGAAAQNRSQTAERADAVRVHVPGTSWWCLVEYKLGVEALLAVEKCNETYWRYKMDMFAPLWSFPARSFAIAYRTFGMCWLLGIFASTA